MQKQMENAAFGARGTPPTAAAGLEDALDVPKAGGTGKPFAESCQGKSEPHTKPK